MTDPEMEATADLEDRREDIRIRLQTLVDEQPAWTTDTFSGLIAELDHIEELLRASYRTDPSRPMTAAEISVADLAIVEARQEWIETRKAELLAMHGGRTPEQSDARRRERRAVMELPPIVPDRRDLPN